MPINEPKQSFIPKKTLGEQGKKKRRTFGLFFGVSVIIFILTVATAGATYSYRSFLDSSISNMTQSLERAKQAFEPALILELKRLNARINSANSILSNHIALSEFLRLLEENTLKTVQFSRFEYDVSGDIVQISLRGKARDYSSVALQSDLFGDSKFIKNPIFSNLGLDQNGNVTFDVVANIDLSLILYKESI